jgi:hypothetical protein
LVGGAEKIVKKPLLDLIILSLTISYPTRG